MLQDVFKNMHWYDLKAVLDVFGHIRLNVSPVPLGDQHPFDPCARIHIAATVEVVMCARTRQQCARHWYIRKQLTAYDLPHTAHNTAT